MEQISSLYTIDTFHCYIDIAKEITVISITSFVHSFLNNINIAAEGCTERCIFQFLQGKPLTECGGYAIMDTVNR